MIGAASEDAVAPRTFVIAASMTLVFILSASASKSSSARMARLVPAWRSRSRMQPRKAFYRGDG
jgi:hypothetical protein